MSEPAASPPSPTPPSKPWRWWTPGPARGRVRNLYLRALGVVFFCAFASWHAQQDGLVGSHGIAPAADLVARLAASPEPVSWREFPSLVRLFPSDAGLRSLTRAGGAAAALLALGVLPLASLLLCFVFYLSLVLTGGPFMRFQWDALLLEAAVASLPLCPPSLRLSLRTPEPHPLAVALPRWLLLSLMLRSGWVKLASHDETWRSLTALTYHWWTQPLPAWTAWYAARLPPLVQRLSTAAMFAIELGCPLFILGPWRRLRLLGAFVPLVLLQLLIAATGTYGFFNLLTVVLCLPLLDDAALAGVLVPRDREATVRSPGIVRTLGAAAVAGYAALYLGLSAGELCESTLRVELPEAAEQLLAAARPFHAVSSYGLFASMTTDRLEIAVQGSDDGEAWREYVFRWKPGPVDRVPGFATPHMPRLDWQMWFAALGTCQQNRWLLAFAQRLLEGRRPVEELLANRPFPDHPPRYLRTPLFRYRFASAEERRRTGAFFAREPLGDYCPVLTLREGRLSAAGPLGKNDNNPVK